MKDEDVQRIAGVITRELHAVSAKLDAVLEQLRVQTALARGGDTAADEVEARGECARCKGERDQAGDPLCATCRGVVDERAPAIAGSGEAFGLPAGPLKALDEPAPTKATARKGKR